MRARDVAASGRRPAAVLALALLFGPALAARPARAAEEGPPVTRIGRYEVTPIGDGIEIRSRRDPALAAGLIASGVLLGVMALALRSGGRTGGAIALGLVALGFVLIGVMGFVYAAHWRAGGPGLERIDRAGHTDARWPREAIASVRVARPARSVDDLRRPGPRPWEVEVLDRQGRALPARFRFESEAQAQVLAGRLAASLGVPIAGP
jgi:hypothetical protein